MTFTYTPASPTDITRVRFHIGDTDEDSAAFSDEEITFVISEQTTWQRAVIACIQTLIARMAATPDFTADWLKVDATSALAGYRALLAEKRRELGVAGVTATATAVYRSDSLQTVAPEDW